jgi:hypothetical protein
MVPTGPDHLSLVVMVVEVIGDAEVAGRRRICYRKISLVIRKNEEEKRKKKRHTWAWDPSRAPAALLSTCCGTIVTRWQFVCWRGPAVGDGGRRNEEREYGSVTNSTIWSCDCWGWARITQKKKFFKVIRAHPQQSHDHVVGNNGNNLNHDIKYDEDDEDDEVGIGIRETRKRAGTRDADASQAPGKFFFSWLIFLY